MPNLSTLTITDRAQSELHKIMHEENAIEKNGIRIQIQQGGCSGLVYKINFGEPGTEDTVLKLKGIEVYIDPKSNDYLKGVYLDYQSGFSGRGFVFDNPQAVKTCSCGDSFKI